MEETMGSNFYKNKKMDGFIVLFEWWKATISKGKRWFFITTSANLNVVAS